MPLFGGQVEQPFPGRDGDTAQLRRHGGRGAAAEGPHVEGRQVRVTHHNFDGFDGRVEFFRYCLRERGAAVLSHLYFAGEEFDDAVLADVHPRRGFFGKPRASASARASAGFLGCGLIGQHEQNYDAATEDFEEVAAVRRELIRGAAEEFVAFGLKHGCLASWRPRPGGRRR